MNTTSMYVFLKICKRKSCENVSQTMSNNKFNISLKEKKGEKKKKKTIFDNLNGVIRNSKQIPWATEVTILFLVVTHKN